jgi:methyl coenzyme M reductase subunit C-like uncharacterized protein (methanogenesis marker protein 7)
MNNVIRTKITANDRNKFDELLSELEAILSGKLTELSDEERAQYGSINEQNKLLVNKVRDYNQTNAALSTPDVDWEEFESDYQTRVFLETRSSRMSNIVHQMEGTKILHDYDNYHDSLNDYAYSQYKKGANVNGYAEKVADLKQFFPRTGQITPTPTT